MKKTIIFDTIGTLPTEITTGSVTAETGVDTENVRSMVFDEIHSSKGKKGKKAFRKRLTVILVAAAVGVAALGTVTAGAMGGFNNVIGEHFSGENLNGVYAGGDVNIQTADGIKAELAGVAGDDSSAMSIIQISKADGSELVSDYRNAYVRNHDVLDYTLNEKIDFANINVEEYAKYLEKNDIIEDEKYPLVLSSNAKNNQEYEYNQAYIKMPAWVQVTNHDYWTQNEGKAGMKDEYYLTDSSHISGYYMYNFGAAGYSYDEENGHTINPKGETAEIEQKALYIYQPVKIIHEGSIADWFDDKKIMVETLKKYAPSITEDEVITYDPETFRWMIAKKTVLNIDLNASYKLNYKNTDVEFAPTNNTLAFDNISYTVNSIHSGPFVTALNITVNDDITSYDIPEYGNYFDFYGYHNGWLEKFGFHSDIRINLTNGKSVDAVINCVSSGASFDENGGTFSCLVGYYDDSQNIWLTINPSEIKSITIAGQTITAK